MTDQELIDLQNKITDTENAIAACEASCAELRVIRDADQLALDAEYARRDAIVRVRQTVAYDATPLRGSVTLFGGSAQSTVVPFDADVATWQSAVNVFGDGLYFAGYGSGSIVIERDEATPALAITRYDDLFAAESCSVEVPQPGIAQGPDSDPPGQAEVIVLNLGNPVGGFADLACNGNVIPPPIRFDTVVSAIGAEIQKLPGWSSVTYLDITNQQQPSGPPWIRRMRFDSVAPVAPGSWSLVPFESDPLVKACNVSFT